VSARAAYRPERARRPAVRRAPAFWAAIGALLSHWRRHPVQGASIVVGLWLATALWTGVQALNAQARADYDRAAATLTGPAEAQLVAAQGGALRQSDYVALRRAGWAVSPVLEGRLRVVDAAGGPLTLQIVGIEPLTLPAGTAVAGQRAQSWDLATFIGPPGQAWIAPDTLRRLGAAPGDRWRVAASDEAAPAPKAAAAADSSALPRLVAQPTLAPGVVVMDIGNAQTVLRAEGQVTRLLLDEAAPAMPMPPALAERVRTLPAEDTGDLRRLTDSFHLNLTALALLAFIVGLFIVNAAIGLALEQRRPLLRTLRACGVSLRTLIGALAAELGVFAVLGGAVGVASGYALAGVLLPDVSASLRGLYGAEVAGQLALSPSWWLAGLSISLLGAVLAGASSLWRAARLPVLAVAQPQAWRAAQSRASRRQAALAVALLAVCGACWAWGNSLASAFGMVGTLLLAAALALPALLDAILAALARLCRRPLATWFVADSRQQLPSLSLALMALLLALSASVGVGSMTEGFRQTFTGWLERRLSADLFITPRDTAQGVALVAWLETQPGVDAVLPQWRSESRVAGWPTQWVGVPDHPSFQESWPLLSAQPQPWAAIAAGEGALVSEQFARRLGVRPGDSVDLTLAGTSVALRIVGWYADYGNPQGQVLVNADWLRRHDPQARMTGMGARLGPGADGQALAERLETRYAGEGARIQDQATLKRWSQEVFDRTFQATAALNTLTLAVAGVALFISLLTLSQSRLVQLAPLWALGTSRAALATLSLAQTLLLAGLTIVLAMPFGLALAWCLVAVVNVQAFGWQLPLYVFPDQLFKLGLLGLVTSLAAAAGPLWRLARRPPADLLRQFAQER